MRQLLLVLTMLISLVICPFDCMGRMTTGDGEGASGRKCGCCSHCTESPATPSVPTSDEQRCDCICSGAVLIDSVSLPADQSLTSAFAVIDVPAAVELALAAVHRESADASGLIRPGRSLHLAMHSWQI